MMITVSEREGCGALSEVDDNVRGRQSAKRGGKNSRARRREKYLESQAACGACWVQLVRGALRQCRAAARASALAAVEHLRSARAKIRAAVWRRWTRRPDVYSECGLCCAYRDTALAPLSLRDEWLLKRASALARHLPEDEFYAYRHVLDWLRVDLKMDGEVLPYWCHTLYAEEQEESSECSSDQDDSCASDQDDLLYQREFKGSTICPYPCPYTKGRWHAELPCRCREIAESR